MPGVALAPSPRRGCDELDRRERNSRLASTSRGCSTSTLGRTAWTYRSAATPRASARGRRRGGARSYLRRDARRSSRRRRPRRARASTDRPRRRCGGCARRRAASSHERRDHARRRVGLGVPLDAQGARRCGTSIASSRSSSVAQPVTDEALAERVDALVVVRLRRVAELARRARGERARREAHVVVGAVERARRRRWSLVADVVGQVLDQRAAARDVHAAASRGRCRAPAGRAPSRAARAAISNASRSGRVPRVSACGSRRRRRVDVGAAGEDQAVEQRRALVGLASAARVGRQHQRERRRRAARRRRRRAASRYASWSHTVQRARSSAVQMPMRGSSRGPRTQRWRRSDP